MASTVVESTELRADVRALEEIPPLPQNTQRLLDVLGDDEVNLEDVARSIEEVPVLAARIVGLSRSAYFGAGTARSVADAIIRVLGLRLVRSLALGWGKHNIRVNCIAPGLVKTDFARALWEDADKLKRTEAAYPLGRIGEPDDIAGMAVCLASKAGAFLTGQTVVVDGGCTIVNARG